jgi:hypothetical protein
MHHQQCRHVTLAGNEISRVIYCETHSTYELVIGSLSLKLDEASFNGMCNLLNDAQSAGLAMRASKQAFEAMMQQIKRA